MCDLAKVCYEDRSVLVFQWTPNEILQELGAFVLVMYLFRFAPWREFQTQSFKVTFVVGGLVATPTPIMRSARNKAVRKAYLLVER